jgi:hypothetical protein
LPKPKELPRELRRCEKDHVSESLPITSLKLNFVAGRVRIVPARDLSGCPFAGPASISWAPRLRRRSASRLPSLPGSRREPILARTLSLDVPRGRLLVTIEKQPRPRVVRIDPSIDASASAEILERAAPLLRHLGGVARDRLAARRLP